MCSWSAARAPPVVETRSTTIGREETEIWSPSRPARRVPGVTDNRPFTLPTLLAFVKFQPRMSTFRVA
jgi:hypothetical protein